MFDEIEADVRAALPAESWSTSRVVACTMLAVRNICHMLRRDFAHEHMKETRPGRLVIPASSVADALEALEIELGLR